ncbi:VanZ family protein [Metabacillus idriensis]|uniref:VanZ family protein n=1 Tax=Metabacillus idriensis TaxID=324768 RepID=UPI00203CB802|nr:VanZ family protein [Metabacillus idriensis]MCM3597476.1 VanZ family protein [Metabacillus idriensis]
MKFITASLFIVLFSLFSFTDDLPSLLAGNDVGLSIQKKPDFSDLLIYHDIALYSKFYLLVKFGHALFFFTFTIIMTFMYRMRTAIVCSLILAASSEILQLYTMRSGRIVDMIYDLSGALAGIILIKLISAYSKHVQIVEGNRQKM